MSPDGVESTENATSLGPEVATLPPGRSSSQTSDGSNKSRQGKSSRISGRLALSAKASVELREDASLTSFPSLSPESDRNVPTPIVGHDSGLKRSSSQKMRARKATLAGLTSTPHPMIDKSSALFDDSPRTSFDVPGSLHLVNDDHIQRLIARVGAVKLIRQYAQDLAARDAELSLVRTRADLRERELKHMLREVDVPSADIERRLLQLQRSINQADSTVAREQRSSSANLNTRITEALSDIQPTRPIVSPSSITAEPGLAQRPAALTRSASKTLKSTPSLSQLHNEHVMSRNSSRASSIVSQTAQDLDHTIRARQNNSSTTRLTGLQNIFQPPSSQTSYSIGGNNKTAKTAKTVDELSVKSSQSTKSTTSWTRIFGGFTQTSRSRASSIEQNSGKTTDAMAPAVGALRTIKNRETTGKIPSAANTRPPVQRTVTANRVPDAPFHVRKGSNASSVPPTVEMDSMIESSQLPPTMSNYNPDGLLVDRYGFIYDRRRKRQQMQARKHIKNKPSKSSSLAGHRAGEVSPKHDGTARPATPASVDDDSPKKSWQEYLQPAQGQNKRPRELLVHTPSASALVTVSTTEAEGTITPPRFREPVPSNPNSDGNLPQSENVDTRGESNGLTTAVEDLEDDTSEYGASKALLEQLTELHDSLQSERTVKWNDFLRRVRAERVTSASERPNNNVPEADLVDGELIGIASLGRSNKTKAKYVHFKTLVLSGIPVSLRPKVWAECSGATSLRIPGYYEDLVAKSELEGEVDKDTAQQIRADVLRTLRDNVFFRNPDAPGVQRLEELLRAYSLHNRKIGYCQGMNLITASLLLICATPEDCFWLLVVIIDHILPSGYFDHNLLVARADQAVLRGYVTEILPKLDAKLQEIGVELEACTFHWFLSLYTGVLTGGEALYRVWDVVLCLNSSDSAPIALQNRSAAATLGVDGYLSNTQLSTPTTPVTPTTSATKPDQTVDEHDGTSSPFLFQLSLALLKLNEEAILALESPAQVYTYLNHNMTAHNITIDALVNASELLRSRIKRSDVLERRKKAVDSLR